MDEITLRIATFADLPALSRLENECFTDPWSIQSLQSTLENDASHLLIAETKEKHAVGSGILYLLFEDAEIASIAVSKQFRRCGIGQSILAQMLALSKESGVKTVFLEVRAGNPAAIALYEKNGFVRYGERKNYYIRPRENAILMQKKLSVP